MNLERERELFLKHSHFEFLMQYVDWDGETWIFKESNSLQDTQNYYNDYLHFIDCWSYWLASINREGYVLVPVDRMKEITLYADLCAKSNGNGYIQERCKSMLGAVDET